MSGFNYNWQFRNNWTLVVPTIQIVLQEGVQCTSHGVNSLVMAKENVACLASVYAFINNRSTNPANYK